MKNLRLILTAMSLAMLTIGYLASQMASLGPRERGAEPPTLAYAMSVDGPAVRYGALAMLILAVGLGLVPERVEQDK